MIRIRFHGRGGHGVKTAGRVAGSAAFLAGLYAQDSPVYGAERRGAAVASYTRIDDKPIRERGVISHPDLVILADETLLSDPAAGVLAGVTPQTAIFVNTANYDLSAQNLATQNLASHDRASHNRAAPDLPSNPPTESSSPRLITLDLTRLTLEALGRASALSAGLGAIAVRLAGVIPRNCLMDSVREELTALGISPEDLERNLRLAGELFDSLPALEFTRHGSPDNSSLADATAQRMAAIHYEGPIRGSPSVLASGNSVARHTGAWRLERPVVDNSICTRCGLCFVQCPDGAVALDADGYPVIDYDHCKGCLICGHVCPARAIRAERETQAW
jgi:pyruvate ferredoxin oxidoreductase gamma subunit